jgi:hypothetical protein
MRRPWLPPHPIAKMTSYVIDLARAPLSLGPQPGDRQSRGRESYAGKSISINGHFVVIRVWSKHHQGASFGILFYSLCGR